MAVARHWRLEAQRYALVGAECPRCHSKHFPPREVCPICRSSAQGPFLLAIQGDAGSPSLLCLALPERQEQLAALLIDGVAR